MSSAKIIKHVAIISSFKFTYFQLIYVLYLLRNLQYSDTWYWFIPWNCFNLTLTRCLSSFIERKAETLTLFSRSQIPLQATTQHFRTIIDKNIPQYVCIEIQLFSTNNKMYGKQQQQREILRTKILALQTLQMFQENLFL